MFINFLFHQQLILIIDMRKISIFFFKRIFRTIQCSTFEKKEMIVAFIFWDAFESILIKLRRFFFIINYL
jgi:hypothetical protein